MQLSIAHRTLADLPNYAGRVIAILGRSVEPGQIVIEIRANSVLISRRSAGPPEMASSNDGSIGSA
jgi:hypothetical protein